MLARMEFGATGHRSSRVIFGAAALSRMRQERADEVLDQLPRYGVNHIDTAAAYGDSELRVGAWLTGRRDEFFLATKTGDRDGAGARRSLERSLERLRVDHVDLIQLHNLVEDDEWEQAFAPDGAVAALAQARDEGLCRFVGVTGHGLRIASMHRRSLARFPFDSVLLPYNVTLLRQPDYRAEVDALLDDCRARGVAVQTIKSIARRRWTDADTEPHFSWYKPIEDADALARAVRLVLSNDQLFLNSSSDARLLGATLEVASGPDATRPPAAAELDADVADLDLQPLFDGGALERI